MSGTAVARKVGFSPPVVTILAKRPEKITRENEFELYGNWFSVVLRCSLYSLRHGPISLILSPSKSVFLSLYHFKAKGVTDGRDGERLNFSGSWRLANLAANCHNAAAPGGAARELILISNIQLFTKKT